MTRRHARFLGALLGGAVAAAGCGEDKSNCTPPQAVDVRNGSWEVQEIIEYSGWSEICFPDSGITNPDTVVVETYQDTLAYCEFHEWGDPTDTDLCCENTLDGNNVDIHCRVTYPLDVCQQVFDVTASGTVTDTTFDVTLRFLDTIAGSQTPCEFYDGWQDTCFTNIHSVGRWISADGDTACTPASRTGQDLLRSVIARSKARVTR